MDSIVLCFSTHHEIVYENGTLHNDLSHDNMLFHQEGGNMNIGICDLDLASRVAYPSMSLYNLFDNKAKKLEEVQRRWCVSKTLFMLYNQP